MELIRLFGRMGQSQNGPQAAGDFFGVGSGKMIEQAHPFIRAAYPKQPYIV